MLAQARWEHAEEVVDVTFPARDQTTRVLEPCEEPFDLPASARTTERASLLRSTVDPNGVPRSFPCRTHLWRLALNIGFNKRTFYSDEREWRASVFQEQLRPRDRGLLLPVDPDVLIRTIRIGPRVDRPTADAVRQVMTSAGLTMPLEESTILKRPRVRRSR